MSRHHGRSVPFRAWPGQPGVNPTAQPHEEDEGQQVAHACGTSRWVNECVSGINVPPRMQLALRLSVPKIWPRWPRDGPKMQKRLPDSALTGRPAAWLRGMPGVGGWDNRDLRTSSFDAERVASRLTPSRGEQLQLRLEAQSSRYRNRRTGPMAE